MTDHTPHTDEELAAMEADPERYSRDAVLRLIADLRACRVEVERLQLRADQAESAMQQMDVDAGRKRAAENTALWAEVKRLRALNRYLWERTSEAEGGLSR